MRELGDESLTGEAFRHSADQGDGLVGQFVLPRFAGEVEIPGQTFEEKIGKGLGFGQALLEGLAPLGAHKRVGVMFRREKDKLEFPAILQTGQGIFQGAPGCLATGVVAVIAADHLGGGAKQQMHMIASG